MLNSNRMFTECFVCLQTHWIFSFDLSQACLFDNCFWKQTFTVFWSVFVVRNPTTSSQKYKFSPLADYIMSLRNPNFYHMVVSYDPDIVTLSSYVAGPSPPSFTFEIFLTSPGGQISHQVVRFLTTCTAARQVVRFLAT